MLDYGVSQAWDSIEWNSRGAVKTLIPETRCYAFHFHYWFNHTHSCYRKKCKVKCLTGALSSGFRDHSAESAGFQTAMLSNDLYTVTADGCEREREHSVKLLTQVLVRRGSYVILLHSPSPRSHREASVPYVILKSPLGDKLFSIAHQHFAKCLGIDRKKERVSCWQANKQTN